MTTPVVKPVTIVFTDKPIIPANFVKAVAELPGTDVRVYSDFPLDALDLYERGKNAVIIIVDPVTMYKKTILERWPKLKAIVTSSVGTDHIDLNYCQEKGITVVNFPGYNARAVAEFAFANLITLLRKIPFAQMHVLAGGWDSHYFQGTELQGKVLGIIGAGNIGRELIAIGKGMGMRLMVNTQHPSPERAEALSIERFYELGELLQGSDFVVIAVPGNDENIHLFNAKNLALMKKSALLINVSRGKVVDTQALALALYQRKLAGAALDVIENEPFNRKNADLEVQEMINSPNVILTPHIAHNTVESLQRMGSQLVISITQLVQEICQPRV